MQIQVAKFVKVAIFKRLVARFNLSDIPDQTAVLLLSPVIQGVTDIDKLLRTLKVAASDALDLQAGAGAYVPAHTCPTGKRWTILGFTVPATTASTSPGVKVGSDSMLIEDGGTAGLRKHTTDIPLEEDDSIGLTTTGNVGDNARVMNIYYWEEDSF